MQRRATLRKPWIYVLGVIPLGFAQVFLRDALGGPVTLVSAIAYLLLLRWFAEKYGRP